MMTGKNQQDRLLSLQEVMQRLHVSDPTLRRWLKAGKIEACKCGRQWRFEESEIKRFIASHKRARDRQVSRVKRAYTHKTA